MLLGILYCHCKPAVRVQKFYELVQVNLEGFLSPEDNEIAEFMPIMAKISYEVMIKLYNRHMIRGGGECQARLQWIPDDQEELEEAYSEILERDDIGLKDKVFTVNAKLSKDQFVQKMIKDAY
jgi:hypothetical protein